MSAIDLLFPDVGRAPYYIFTLSYSRYSAGIKVLHVLCHLLNQTGQSAFLVPANPLEAFNVNPDLVTPLLTPQIAEEHFRARRTPVVIYPETVSGNPLNASCVVRFLLNYPGLISGQKEFSSNDFLAWYSGNMKEELKAPGVILSIPASDARLYYPPPAGTKRQGSCFYAYKYRNFSGLPLSPLTKDSVEIPGWAKDGPTQKEIADLFRRSEVFYCYEASALGLESILCGCPVVLIPSEFFKKPILVEAIGWTGVAWGDSPAEWERAKNTVGEIPAKYEAWMNGALTQVKEFIALTQEKARHTPYNEKVSAIDPYRFDSKLKKTVRAFIPPGVVALKWKIKGLLKR